MEVRFKIRNVEKVQKFLASVPYGTLKVALEAVAENIIGDKTHGLKHPDKYRFVSRKSAYGSVSKDGAPDGYFSWKQFRYVAWKTKGFTTNMGSETYRTGTSSDAWRAVPTNKGYGYSLVNDTAGAYFTRDDYGQARQPAKVGWRKVSQVVNDNLKGAFRSALAAVNKYLKTKR